jgi:hypothetical protein
MSVVSVCPNIDLALLHKDVFLKSGDSVSMRQWISTSTSNNQCTFSCPPPSLSTFIDRFILLKLNAIITYTGTTTGQALLQTGADALRAYPIASITNNTQLTINSQSYSFLTSDIIPYLAHFFEQSHLSGFPDFLDKYQNYINGINNNNNPLAQYGNSIGKIMPRGAFPMIVVNGVTSSTITADIYEPLWIPILHGCEYDQGLGLSNIRTFDINVNFNSNLSRIVSHAILTDPGTGLPITTLTNVSVSIGAPPSSAPVLYMKYTSPPYGYVPRPLEYACDAVDRFVTSYGSSIPALGQVDGFISSNMQLNAIPDRMLVFVREASANLTYTSTDTVCRIDKVSINFNNQSGLLASAKPIDLFNMSKSNQLQDTWEEYNGQIVNLVSGSGTPVPVGTVGSFLMLKFGKDISLSPGDWPGKIGAYNLQLTIGVTNVNQLYPITSPSLFVICFTPQKCVIDTGGAIQNILGIPESAGRSSEYVSYHNVMKHYGGSFSDFISKVGSFFRPIVDVLRNSKLISTIASAIPHPIAQTVGQVASKMGFGDGRKRRSPKGGFVAVGDEYDDGMGGFSTGGAVMSRSDLLERIKELN